MLSTWTQYRDAQSWVRKQSESAGQITTDGKRHIYNNNETETWIDRHNHREQRTKYSSDNCYGQQWLQALEFKTITYIMYVTIRYAMCTPRDTWVCTAQQKDIAEKHSRSTW